MEIIEFLVSSSVLEAELYYIELRINTIIRLRKILFVTSECPILVVTFLLLKINYFDLKSLYINVLDLYACVFNRERIPCYLTILAC